jgi:PAS domain S-box-containing protein
MTPNTAVPRFDAALLVQAQELVHVGTWVWDVQSGAVSWSDELFRLFGLEPQSIPLELGTYLSFVHHDDRARVSEVIAAALATKSPFQFDHRLVTASGTVIHHHARGNMISDADGTVIRMIGACIDITDRVQHQEAQRESEERFRSIFEQSAVGLALADSTGRFVSVNPSYAHFLGYACDELTNTLFTDITHPDDLAVTKEMMESVQSCRSSFTYEKRYLRKDGETVWGRATVTRLRHDDGSPDGYMGVIEDITDRKLAHQALVRQTELLQGIMDHLPVMISLFDTNGKALYVNREWRRMFGWSLEEAQAIDLFNAVYPTPEQVNRARAALTSGKGTWCDFDPTARDGRTIPSSWACIALSDGTSLTIGQDMTERRQLQQRIVQSEKMEGLGQLAGGIAHDFNNLLTIISACATFAQEAVDANTSATDDIKEIIATTNRAAALTRQLLAFSRRQMLKPQIVDVNASIEQIGKTLSRLVGEHIELAIVPSAEASTVEADVHQLEQVLLNLVVNARDAIRDSGTITVETSNVDRELGEERKSYLVISVSDDGCGIDPSIRDRLFEPFFTTKEVGKGTGLGLATVHGIVAQSGGSIDVESELGKGTTFHVSLPLVKGGETTVLDAVDTDQLRGNETVLLVEDEAALRAVARRVLTGLGYTVLEARHGGDGARISASYAGTIHLLITDVVMPVLGGRELTRRVRAQRPGTPVLYVSGYTDDELLRKGVLEPGAQLLRKPFMPAELALAARQLLRGAEYATTAGRQ